MLFNSVWFGSEIMKTEFTQSQRFGSFVEAEAAYGLSRATLKRLIVAGRLAVFRPVGGRSLLDFAAIERLIRSSAGAPATRGGRAGRTPARTAHAAEVVHG